MFISINCSFVSSATGNETQQCTHLHAMITSIHSDTVTLQCIFIRFGLSTKLLQIALQVVILVNLKTVYQLTDYHLRIACM